jgi:hypothetical protein
MVILVVEEEMEVVDIVPHRILHPAVAMVDMVDHHLDTTMIDHLQEIMIREVHHLDTVEGAVEVVVMVEEVGLMDVVVVEAEVSLRLILMIVVIMIVDLMIAVLEVIVALLQNIEEVIAREKEIGDRLLIEEIGGDIKS